jgi:hypothetical protein
MAGLLDFYGDPQANMALAAGLLSGGNFGTAMGRGMAGAQAVQMAEQERRLRESQARENEMRAQAYRDKVEAEKANAQRDAQFQQALQKGVPLPQLAQYFPDKVDLLKKLADAPNFGRQSVARTIDGTDEQGRPVTYQVDQFGERIGGGIGQWKAPVQVNQGDRQTFVNPVDMKPMGSFGLNMSPSERDASARGWASNGMARERLNMDRQSQVSDSGGPGQAELAKQFGKAPAGFRWKDDGSQEMIPGGPADMKQGASGAKIQDAKDVIDLLNQAAPLLKKSTGSYLGAGVDMGAQAFGISTPGARAAAELKALQGALISKMPKMTGPQSDKDVQLYREMAGQIGDPTIPVETREAAARTIRTLNERYAGQQAQPTKRVTLSDIAETARRSGKSTADVTAAFRAKGYEIGGN